MLAIDWKLFLQGGVRESDLLAAMEEVGKTGVTLSFLYSFNGAGAGTPGGKRPAEWLAEEPVPRRLALIGMADAYGNGAATSAEVVKLDDRSAHMSVDELRTCMPELLATYARSTWRQAPAFCQVLTQFGVSIS